MLGQLVKYRFTADQYERMGEAGIFRPEARLMLLEGSLYDLPPISPSYISCITNLIVILHSLQAGDFIIASQNPIRLDEYSETQMDIALLRQRKDFYGDATPMPADVLLVIEVADSTVESDGSYKMPLYAKAGIPEAWLVNLPDEKIELYAEPADGAYQFAVDFKRGEDVRAHSIADLFVPVADVLG